jgi:hypothetical protein
MVLVAAEVFALVGYEREQMARMVPTDQRDLIQPMGRMGPWNRRTKSVLWTKPVALLV